jgi:hypothetical protein
VGTYPAIKFNAHHKIILNFSPFLSSFHIILHCHLILHHLLPPPSSSMPHQRQKCSIDHGGEGVLHRCTTVVELRKLVAAGSSESNAAIRLGMNQKSLGLWNKEYNCMLIFGNKSLVAMKIGPTSQLQHIKSDILKFFFEHHKQGFPVSHCSVVMYSSKLLPEYGVKTPVAQCLAMKHFLLAHDFVHRLGTHISQKSPSLIAATCVLFCMDQPMIHVLF